MSKLTVVVGGQYGSEGKGNVAGELHKRHRYGWGVRVGGPNAGHTVVDSHNHSFPLRQIPVAAAVDPECKLFIAPGSEIDAEVLKHEITLLEANGHVVANRLWINTEATVITDTDKRQETEMPYGSTQKGIGAARAARAMRTAKLARENINFPGLTSGCNLDGDVLIEGTQGYGLGLHAGGYPHCTSADCRAIDFMAQAGCSPYQEDLEIWVVLRTYPIRIAGSSGPLKEETTWDEVGVEPEFTTVTKKMRRVGQWDADLAAAAVHANGGLRCKVALTFADYWYKDLALATDKEDVPGSRWEQVEEGLRLIEGDIGARIEMIGTGPKTFIHTPGGLGHFKQEA